MARVGRARSSRASRDRAARGGSRRASRDTLLAIAVGLGMAYLAAGCGGGEGAVAACSDEPGTACTWAGTPQPPGFNADGLDRRATWMAWPTDVAFAPDGRAWIVDWNNHRVRVVEDDDTVTTAIGNGSEGDGTRGPDGMPDHRDGLPLGDPEGAPGPEVELNHPTDLDFTSDGDVVLASWHNLKIRHLDVERGIVTVLAGTGYGFHGDGGPAHLALLDLPRSVAVDDDDRIFIVDQHNQRIRAIDPDGERTIDTVAGVGRKGFSGDGGPALDAELAVEAFGFVPGGGIAVDDASLYVADAANHRIRRIDRASGMIETIAGSGAGAYAGDGGPALDAALYYPTDLELGPDGRLYVADTGNSRVRAIDLQRGIIEHVAGTGAPCPPPDICVEAAEGLPAAEVVLNQPYGVGFDAAGALYVADTYNSRIVRIAP